MIDGYRRHDRNVGIDDVDRIESTSEPDLQHGRVEFRLRKQTEDRQRRVFEVGERRLGASLLDGFELGN